MEIKSIIINDFFDYLVRRKEERKGLSEDL